MEQFSLKELQEMPTLYQGHFDNLKIDKGNVRVWLSRMTIADGAPYDNLVFVQELICGDWIVIDEYRAK